MDASSKEAPGAAAVQRSITTTTRPGSSQQLGEELPCECRGHEGHCGPLRRQSSRLSTIHHHFRCDSTVLAKEALGDASPLLQEALQIPGDRLASWQYDLATSSLQDFAVDIFAIDSNRVNLASLCHGQSKITSEKECSLAANCHCFPVIVAPEMRLRTVPGNERQCEDFHLKLEAEQKAWLERELPGSNAHWNLGGQCLPGNFLGVAFPFQDTGRFVACKEVGDVTPPLRNAGYAPEKASSARRARSRL